MPETDKDHNSQDQPASRPLPDPTEQADSKAMTGRAFPVVGLGASAGGLEALKTFFSEVPGNSGMAYIVVVHMVADQPSLMPEFLQRVAKISVTTASDGERLQPDRIYVVPPGKEISLYKDAIQLLDFLDKELSPPIDSFFRSLAQDQQTNAVGIILSGTGTDGTRGIKEIKVNELFAAHDDMRNLLNSTEIATIFVDNDMRVKRFTQKATAIINLIQTDIGRPLQHVVTNLAYEGMIRDLADVMEKLIPRDAEVMTTAGKWYSMRIMPYRTTDNRIDGAVLTFADINDQKDAQSIIESTSIKTTQAWLLIRSILDMNPKPLANTNQEGVAVTANKAFEQWMNIPRDQVERCNVFNISGGVLKNVGTDVLMRSDLDEGKEFKTPAFTIERPEGKKTVFVHGRVIGKKPELLHPFLLHFEEIPEEAEHDA